MCGWLSGDQISPGHLSGFQYEDRATGNPHPAWYLGRTSSPQSLHGESVNPELIETMSQVPGCLETCNRNRFKGNEKNIKCLHVFMDSLLPPHVVMNKVSQKSLNDRVCGCFRRQVCAMPFLAQRNYCFVDRFLSLHEEGIMLSVRTESTDGGGQKMTQVKPGVPRERM